eukprot:augustus_masked-scaffold_5-processed-gene-11.36-mRNA-1 protein AED:0.01 eAED:0.03 QI:0/-1/0/1/-1/1/1/0/495
MIFHEIRTFLKRTNIFQCYLPLKRSLSSFTAVDITEKLGIQTISDEFSKKPFLTDWTGEFCSNKESIVALPKSTEEVSNLLKFCSQNDIKVVPQGGNTNLVGSSICTQPNSVLLSLQKLNKVVSLNKRSNLLVAEAGCILDSLQSVLDPHELLLPIDLGSKGSCTIGGNVSTNAGGIRYARYGSLKQNVLGLEVVLPSGEIMDLTLSGVRKNSTGLDLKQLFLGTEGTFGVITKVAINVVQQPSAVNLCLLGFKNFSSLERCIEIIKASLAEVVSAVEFWDDQAMHLHMGRDVRNPFSLVFPFYLLVETNGSNVDHDIEKIENFIEEMVSEDLLFNENSAVLASTLKEQRELWEIRETFTVALREKGGYTLKSDLAFPNIGLMNEATQFMKQQSSLFEGLCTADYNISQYGHILDGNLHLEVWFKEKDAERIERVKDTIYEFVDKKNGSISAEHGIGLLKKKPFLESMTEAKVDLLSALKKTIDPRSIMNPGKIF